MLKVNRQCWDIKKGARYTLNINKRSILTHHTIQIDLNAMCAPTQPSP